MKRNDRARRWHGATQSRGLTPGLTGLVLAAVLVASGCNRTLSPEDYLDRASAAYEAGDLRSALIDLKALLSENGDHAAGRLLLARLYTDRGDFDLAGQELDKALASGGSRAAVLPLQAYIWRRIGKEEELLALDVSAEAGDVAAAILVQQASMLMAGGWLEDAGDRLDQAEGLAPASLQLVIERARLSALRGDSASARTALEEITSSEGHPDAWVLLATLEKRAGNHEAAVAAYTEAITLRPNNYIDVVERGFLNLQLARLEAAEQDFSRVAERYPNHYLANYGRGMVQELSGEPELALASVQSALGVNPDFPPALLLQGALQLDQGMVAQAVQSLSRFNRLIPGTFEGQALLGIARGVAGDLQQAEPLLRAAMAINSENIAVLVQLAQVLTGTGDIEEARGLVQEAIELKPQDHQLRQLLGMNFLLANRPLEAEEQFALAAELPGGDIAGYPSLVRYYLAEGDNVQAMALAERLVAQHPGSPQAITTLGWVHRQAGQPGEAKVFYQRALELDAGNPEAHFQMAAMALEQRDFDAAEDHYAGVLEVYPENVQAKLMMAELERRRGDPDAREALLKAAVAEHPGVTATRLALAQYQIEVGEVNQALVSLDEIATAEEPRESVRSTRAQALLARGDFESALREFEALLESQPENPQYLYYAGRSSEALGDAGQARLYFQQAAALDGKFLSPRLSLHGILVRAGDLDSARAVREETAKLGADDSYILEMEVVELAAAGNIDQAITRAGQLLAKQPSTEHQLLAAKLLWQGEQRSQATDSLESWLKDNPGDQVSRSLLAGFYLADGENARSRELYETVVESGTATPRALNNLAYLFLETDPVRALALAGRAVQAAPESADILDTLAWAEHANGQRQLALRTSNRAVQMAPESPQLKWSNIQFQMALDNKDEAMAALGELLEQYEQFPGREEAEEAYQGR